jgi:hypothetical protein
MLPNAALSHGLAQDKPGREKQIPEGKTAGLDSLVGDSVTCESERRECSGGRDVHRA